MIVLSLTTEQVSHYLTLLEFEERQLNTLKETGTLAEDVCTRLLKSNQDTQAILRVRLS